MALRRWHASRRPLTMPDPPPPFSPTAPSYAATKTAYEQLWATRSGALPPVPTTTGAPAPGPAPARPLGPAPTTRHQFAQLVGVDAWIKPECLKPVRRLGSGSFATGEKQARRERAKKRRWDETSTTAFPFDAPLSSLGATRSPRRRGPHLRPRPPATPTGPAPSLS